MDGPSRSWWRWGGWLTGPLALLLTGCITGCPGTPPPSPPGTGGGTPVTALPELAGPPAVRVLLARGPSMVVASTGGYRLYADDALVASSGAALPDTNVSRSSAWAVGGGTYPGRRLRLEGVGGSLLRLGGASYRGSLVLEDDGGGSITAVNCVDLESYLAGVLSRELFPAWDAVAYHAQAVAARSYALYEMSTTGRSRPYDVNADQSSQVYGGAQAETDKAWRAVRGTRGLVLTVGPSGAEGVIRAHFSSTCGGMTNSVSVLYGPPVREGPLGGGYACPDCAGATRYRWAPVRISKDLIFRAIRAPFASHLSDVRTIQPVDELHGRTIWLDVYDSANRRARLRAEDLRLCLLRDGSPAAKQLYSMNCTIRDVGDAILFENGRGFGHGVGLCQWGAQGAAARGLSFERILALYYPGARLTRAY